VNRTTIENNLYTWILGIVTPTPVTFLDQNAPRLTVDYVGLRVNAVQSMGLNGYKSKPTPLGVITITQDMEFKLMIMGYGSNGVTALGLIEDALQNPAKLRLLETYGLAYLSNDGLMNVPEIRGNHFEPRASLDASFRIANVQAYTEPLLDYVNVELTVKEGTRAIFSKVI
jgi:hypothetical protein